MTEPIRVTFVLWDPETDGVAVKHDDIVIWRESSFDHLDQYLRNAAPVDTPVIIEWEV
mgnify:FL=1